MPPLQVRDLPQEIYEPLKHVAELERRSLAQQTIVALEYFLEHHEIAHGKVVEKHEGNPAPFTPFERDGITYMVDPSETPNQRKKRLEEVFARIAARPPLPMPSGYSSTADLIREMREERTDQIVSATKEDPWQ